MKSIIGTIAGAVGSFIIAFMVVAAFAGKSSQSDRPGPAETASPATAMDDPLGTIVKKMAATANAMSGSNVASNVIVEKATISNGGKVVTYHYRLTNVSAGNYDRGKAQSLKAKLQKKACRDRINKKALKLGGEIRYTYKGAGGVRFFTIPINNGVCKTYA